MPYKRNPMRSERICSLSRYLMADAANAPMTASTQWLERTLDDSANRRISLPEGFLCADAVLRLCQSVTNGLHVNEKIVERTLREYLPFLATENIMMEAVKRGGNRQELHEKIRQHSMAATARMKEGEPCDLLRPPRGRPRVRHDARGARSGHGAQALHRPLRAASAALPRRVRAAFARCRRGGRRDRPVSGQKLRMIPEREGWTSHLSRFFFYLKKCAAARVALAKAGRIPVSEQIVKGVRSYTKGSECPWIRVSKCAIKKL